MKYVIHYEIDGHYSADTVEALSEEDAFNKFDEKFIFKPNIIKIKPLEVKHNAVPKRVEYNLHSSVNIKQRRH